MGYPQKRNYNNNQRRNLSDNYIGQVGALVQTEGANFSVTLRNSTQEKKHVALFVGDLLPLLMKSHTIFAVEDGSSNKIGEALRAVGGFLVQINEETDAITVADEIQTLFDDPTILKKYMERVDAVLNNGFDALNVAGKVIYSEADGKHITVESDVVDINSIHNQVNRVSHLLNDIVVSVNDKTILDSAALYYKNLKAYSSTGEDVFKFLNFKSEQQTIETQITINTKKRYNKVITLDENSLLVLALPGLTGGTAEMTLNFNLTALNDISKMSIDAVVNNMTGNRVIK